MVMKLAHLIGYIDTFASLTSQIYDYSLRG
uniref:Uncharacterized protein n=1 Tax=Rhizophora mucronata TaxID=61149 RepID=A0A2P2IIN7_RHIMU